MQITKVQGQIWKLKLKLNWKSKLKINVKRDD